MNTRLKSRKTGRFTGVAAEERQAQRRQMLIDSGIELFGTHGYHAVTVRELCREAGLTERYFYESFANREALFAAVYDELTTRLREQLVAVLLPAPRNVGAMARAALTHLFSALRDDPRMMRVLFVDVFTVSDEVTRMSRRSTAGFAGLLKSMIDALIPESRREGLDTSLIAQGLVGACMNTVMYWAFSGFRETLEDVVANCALLFDALATQLGTAQSPQDRRD